MSNLAKARLLGGSGAVIMVMQIIFVNQYASFMNAHHYSWGLLVYFAVALVAGLMLNLGFIYWEYDRTQKRNARDPHIMRKYGLPKGIKSRLRTIAKVTYYDMWYGRVSRLCDDTKVFFQGEYSLDQLREFTEQLDYLIESLSARADIKSHPQRYGDAEELREKLDQAVSGYAATIAGALQRRNASLSPGIRETAEKLIARGNAEDDIQNPGTPNS